MKLLIKTAPLSYLLLICFLFNSTAIYSQRQAVSAPQAYQNYYNKFGYTWIDLRNTTSIQKYGKIPKSVNVEYSTFGEFATRLQRSGLTKNGRYVLYDTSGGMVKTIITQMRQLGYSNAFYIQGGHNEWKRYKYPSEIGFGGGGEHGGNWSNIPPVGITDMDASMVAKYANSPRVIWLDFRRHKSPINNLSNLNSKINSSNPLVFRAMVDKLDKNASYIFFTDRGHRNSYLRKVFKQKNFRSVKSVHGVIIG